MSKLLPCPFCDEENAEMKITDEGAHYIGCNQCGAEGPFTAKPETATLGWNTRPALPRATSQYGELKEPSK